MKALLKKMIKSFPGTRLITRAIEKHLHMYHHVMPPGAYYSPIPSMEEYRKFELLLKETPSALNEINFNVEEQQGLAKKLQEHFKIYPYRKGFSSDFLFRPDNDYFSSLDATILFCMLCEFKPNNIIEVGSGYSSALMLDVSKTFMQNKINIHCIEPFPERLCELTGSRTDLKLSIHQNKVQEIDLSFYEKLEAGDLFFVDSGHVAKAGSDVNWILFEVLPRLKPGVIIHFHDIFWPFTYPAQWLEEGRYWSEAYLLRAYLANNQKYKVVFFNALLEKFFPAELGGLLRHNEVGRTGSSLYIQKVSS